MFTIHHITAAVAATNMVERPACAIVAKRGGQPDTTGTGGSQGE